MSTPAWEQRFRTAVSFLPEWSPAAPRNAVYVSNESGDLAGARLRHRDRRAAPGDRSPGRPRRRRSHARRRGRALVPGRERRRVRPLARAAVPRRRDVGRSWTVFPTDGTRASHRRPGSSSRPSPTATASPSTCRSTAARPSGSIARTAPCASASVDTDGFLRGALSADGALLCLEHAEHGDLIHPALRVLDPRTGETVGEQLDEGMSLERALLVSRPG